MIAKSGHSSRACGLDLHILLFGHRQARPFTQRCHSAVHMDQHLDEPVQSTLKLLLGRFAFCNLRLRHMSHRYDRDHT